VHRQNDAQTAPGEVRIRGSRLVLRALAPAEIDEEWQAMRAVFRRAGWTRAGSRTEFGRDWVTYRITRRQWRAR